MTLLTIRGLSAGYAGTAVTRGLDLDIEPGEVVGLFGPNGAGKTTVLATIAGLLPPVSGTVTVLGRRVDRRTQPQTLARSGVRLVRDDRGLFRQLTTAENLRLGHPRRRGRAAAIAEVLEGLPQLRGLLGRPAGLLSGGEQQQLAVARALVGAPKLLLVDEMSMGLAPLIAQELLVIVRREAVRRGIGVLLVEQHVPLALRAVDRAVVLNHGDVAFSGTAAELSAAPDIAAASYLGTAALAG